MTPVPDPAHTAGAPTALVCLHDLGRIAEGSTVTVAAVDGSKVQIRLASVDEYLAEVAVAHAWQDEHRLPHPPAPSRAEVEHLVRPIGGHQ